MERWEAATRGKRLHFCLSFNSQESTEILKTFNPLISDTNHQVVGLDLRFDAGKMSSAISEFMFHHLGDSSVESIEIYPFRSMRLELDNSIRNMLFALIQDSDSPIRSLKLDSIDNLSIQALAISPPPLLQKLALNNVELMGSWQLVSLLTSPENRIDSLQYTGNSTYASPSTLMGLMSILPQTRLRNLEFTYNYDRQETEKNSAGDLMSALVASLLDSGLEQIKIIFDSDIPTSFPLFTIEFVQLFKMVARKNFSLHRIEVTGRFASSSMKRMEGLLKLAFPLGAGEGVSLDAYENSDSAIWTLSVSNDAKLEAKMFPPQNGIF